jgi:hypothetical protein
LRINVVNKTVLGIILIVAITAIVGFYIYSENTRYYMQPTGEGIVYKIDRKTGKTWIILGPEERLIESPNMSPESPEYKAIRLVKDSHVLERNERTEGAIKDVMERKKGNLQITGWEGKKINDQIYLVSYTYDAGYGAVGWFFEVNLVSDIVRMVIGDIELEEKYGLARIENSGNRQKVPVHSKLEALHEKKMKEHDIRYIGKFDKRAP